MREVNVDVPISDRARKYGYIIWPKAFDQALLDLLEGAERVTIVLDTRELGSKRIDRKHRRISLGPTQTRRIDAGRTKYRLTRVAPDRVDVTTL